MRCEEDEWKGVADKVASTAIPTSKRLLRVPTPAILEANPDTHIYRFPTQIDFDVTSHNNVANRRRGRYVIKLAATLFLAMQADFNTPGRCSDAMAYLWGHTRLAQEYLRRNRPLRTPCASYTSQQLIKAEGQWKAALGLQVLEADGFQRCWHELEPFFERCLEELRKVNKGVPVSKSPNGNTVPPAQLSSLAEPLMNTRASVAAAAAVAAVAAAAKEIVTPAAPLSAVEASSGFCSAAKQTVRRTTPSLDLAKVPARGVAVLYEKTVRFLRLASTARRAGYANATPEEAFLASRGWMPVRQVLDGVYADLSSDSALKTLWAWWLTVPADQMVVHYLSLLLLLRFSGELQFLQDQVCRTGSNGGGVEFPLSSVTHLRAAWGHDDKSVAAAVMQEHSRVPLRSLVDGTASEAAPSGAPQQPRASGWFEYCNDAKVLRKEMVDVGGRVFTPEGPYQLLLPRDVFADLCAPLRPVSLQDPSSPAASLAPLMRRTKKASKPPDGKGSAAFGVTSTETFVTQDEFEAMLHPSSSFAIATAVAAMTFAASRLALVQVSARYFTRQDETVCGLEVPLRMVHANCSPHRRGANNSDSCGVVNEAREGDRASSRLSAVAAPGSTRSLLVLPHGLTYGLLQPTSMRNVGAAPPSSSPLRRDSFFPAAACVVDPNAVYDVAITGGGGPWVRVLRPPTKLLVDLRIASFWDLWQWYGFTLSPSPSNVRGEGAACNTQHPSSKKKGALTLWPRRLMVEDEMNVLVKPSVPLSLRPEASSRSLPPPSSFLSSIAASVRSTASPQVEGGAEDDDDDAEQRHGSDSGGAANAGGGAETTDVAATPVVTPTEETFDAIPRFPWEYFPAAQAEALVLRLDAAYKAGLKEAWEGWNETGLSVLKPPYPSVRSGLPLSSGGPRSGTRGGDILRSLIAAGAETSPATAVPAAVPEWQMREHALWDGLSRWVSAVQKGCAMPTFSLLLPPNLDLQPPPSQSAISLTKRRLGTVGRRKGMAALRRLFGAMDSPTNFFIVEERVYAPQHNFDTYGVWVLEEAATENEAKDDVSGASAAPPRASDNGGHLSCTDATRDEVRWAIAQRPEVLLADMRDNHDERVVGMYLQHACVLHRSPNSPCTRGRSTAGGEMGFTALAQDGVGDSAFSALRLLRFVGSGAHVEGVDENTLHGAGDATACPSDAHTSAIGACRAPGGIMEEISLHSPLRHAHCGCRVSPFACDELLLGAAWPAEAIVDYVLVPPLREAVEVYYAKRSASAQTPSCERRSSSSGAMRDTFFWSAPPSATAVAAIISDLRRELLRVLTDEVAMEQREFYGDGLLDYCVAVTTLSYRHASSNFAIWRGGNITESSTNSELVMRALPTMLRDYWMSRRGICNDKRLADCVESLFGALSMALWVLPLRRRRAFGAERGDDKDAVDAATLGGAVGTDQDVPAPDADVLIYVASALLQLLSGSSKDG
ncbi:Dcl2, dicer-like protein [Leptomonas pyrrhocoris]|uniref:Dcl2, dicer-like protein n=1 Tax=Leptomonas pyrrhocoris TaxID=157538 RepID=A0A0M9G0B6_LEPPY|nr:Dcl2, dicer-like protein [Leptomonas pyrrhocoris]KPA79599.1 Dcl2, dicer-like protein [Leptomonas pyrrhocoris]|eukprot:XP_015658038.1 Dcl2, dicer-like protein [Leptomonas pyrrhocoris]